jgi:group I intron endonuclease
MGYGIIYKITNKINGKVYVGQTTKELHKRWTEHLYPRPTRKFLLHKAMDKYGRDNFTIEQIAETNTPEELDEFEKKYIKQFNSLMPNGYNLEAGGYSRKVSHQDTKDKLRDANTGFKCKQPNVRRVTCKDIKTGIEWSYANMGLALMDGYCRPAFHKVCQGKYSQYKGKFWKFSENVDYPQVKLKRKSRYEQKNYLLIATSDTETLVFKNIKEACDKRHFHHAGIEKCLKDKTKSYKGYAWRIE